MLSSYFLSDHSLSLKEGGPNQPPPNGSHPVKQSNVTRVKNQDITCYNSCNDLFITEKTILNMYETLPKHLTVLNNLSTNN